MTVMKDAYLGDNLDQRQTRADGGASYDLRRDSRRDGRRWWEPRGVNLVLNGWALGRVRRRMAALASSVLLLPLLATAGCVPLEDDLDQSPELVLAATASAAEPQPAVGPAQDKELHRL